MPNRFIVLLVVTVTLSISAVHMRHESRTLFAELQAQQAERDALIVEWGKLLLEEGAWSQHLRVEAMARNRLSMKMPDAERIHVVRIQREATP